jgi:hypothetical protein
VFAQHTSSTNTYRFDSSIEDFDLNLIRLMMSFVGEVAQTDFYGWSTLKSLEGVRVTKDSEFPLMVRIQGRADVDVAPVAVEGAFKTIARVQANRSMDAQSIELQSKDVLSRLKMPDASNLLAKIGNARIEIAKDIRLIWPKVILSEERLWAAVHLLQRLATEHQGGGVFR